MRGASTCPMGHVGKQDSTSQSTMLDGVSSLVSVRRRQHGPLVRLSKSTPTKPARYAAHVSRNAHTRNWMNGHTVVPIVGLSSIEIRMLHAISFGLGEANSQR